MASSIRLRPINDIVAGILREVETDIVTYAKRMREQTKDRIQLIDQTRQALALLDAAGFDLDISEYASGGTYRLDLGYFSNTKAGNRALANKVRTVRLALGSRLENAGKEIADGKKKHVNHMLKAKDFPGITVLFQRRIPAGASCKIVTQRSFYKSLVCTGI